MSDLTKQSREKQSIGDEMMSEYFLSHGSHTNAANGRCAMESLS